MYEITYCSTANPNLSAEDLSDILETAQSFNAKNNITGCLLYYNQEFIQILEGEKEIIKELYSHISKDKRHTDLILLAEGKKQDRVFYDWSMTFYELSPNDAESIGKAVFADNLVTFSNLVKKTYFPHVPVLEQGAAVAGKVAIRAHPLAIHFYLLRLGRIKTRGGYTANAEYGG